MLFFLSPKTSQRSFKLAGREDYFARYGDLACSPSRKSVAGAALLQMAPSIEQKNTQTDVKFASLAELDKTSKQRSWSSFTPVKALLEWFSVVTPLTEIDSSPHWF